MGLREVESRLPPGFRFYPSDEELICHYLYKKVANEKAGHGTLEEVDLHSREPWELPEVAKLSENEWYFFSFRDRKYSTGSRANRATRTGYWKATGKDRTVYDPSSSLIVGMRKTLVFYCGRAPNGTKTGWVMHEFRLETPHSPPKEGWVLCRVFSKNEGERDHHKEITDIMNSSSRENLHHHQMLEHDDETLNGGSMLSSNTSTYYKDDNNNIINNSNSIRNNNTYLMQYYCNLDANDFPQEIDLGPIYDEHCGLLRLDHHHHDDVVSLEEIGFYV